MTEPTWIREDVVMALHARQISEHGGQNGLRDANLLSSALARPRNQFAYSEPPPDIAAMCAAYAYGFCKHHAFLDGNKRTALVVARLFASMNGYDLVASQAEKYRTFVSLAAGEIEEPELAACIRGKLVARPR